MREYACIMLDYDMPEFVKELQKSIPEEELYLGETDKDKEDDNYGLEKEAHITLVYGLNNNVKFSELEEYLLPIKEYQTILVNISTFTNDNFDVLKVGAKCPKADISNKDIMDNFNVHTDYKEYLPHMTIAYLKKGFAKKYTKDMLNKIDTIKPFGFNYSYSKDGEDKNEYYD